MTTIISFDPGYATGVATGYFDDDTPLEQIETAIIEYPDWHEAWTIFSGYTWDIVVSEKFELANNDFKADLTPVKIEGTLELLYGDDIQWRLRNTKEQVPDEMLKELGWWQTGADVEWEDGRDANDAIIHLLGYVAFDLNHLPTLRQYFRD